MESTKITRLKEGEKVARNAIFVNLFLAFFKVIIGFASGSIALITDGIHTGADSITTFASWFGLKISQRKPTEKFPYGYYRVETIISLFICIFLIFAGYELIKESYSKLFILSTLKIPFWALGISLISSLASFLIAKKEKIIGEKINSQSLITISEDTKINGLISFAVFVGIVATYFQITYIEGIVGILISLMVFKVAIENGKNSIYSLIDVSPSKDIEDEVKRIINSTPGVQNFEDLKLRYGGPFILGEVKIRTKKFLNVKRAHEISDKIENEVKDRIEEVISLNIHIEPYKSKKQKIAIPVEDKNGLRSKLSNHFGRSEYFIFISLDGKRIGSHYFKENLYKEKKVRAGLFFINKIITKEKVDSVITRSVGTISFHALRDHFIDIYPTNKKTVESSVNDFINGKLDLLKKPTKKLGQERVERGN